MIRSLGSIIFGIICVIGTVIVLFGHVRSIDDLTLNHLYIMLSLTVTLGAGHFLWESKNPFVITSFAVLFLVGTVVCVGLSGGRSAEVIAQKEIQAVEARKKRDSQRATMNHARALADDAHSQASEADKQEREAQQEAAFECASGKGTRCDGKTANLAAAKSRAHDMRERARLLEEQYRTEKDRYEALPEPPPPNADLMQFARVVAYIRGMHPDDALEEVKLLLPYALALLTEFGTIMFFKHGFKRRPETIASTVTPDPIQRVSLNDIAQDLGIEPKLARKTVRALGIPKPPEGWCWSSDEAQRISAQIAQARTHRPPATTH